MHGDIRPAVAGAERDLLRVLTCGSVDDGKSTLIGRLLFDSNLIPDDQLNALARDSRCYGTAGEQIDYSLLLDGLEAEREQHITIDVAYRFFSTARRSFIVADAPGHIQYTRNMATGASRSDIAVILVDATKGLMPQTKRHTYICSLMGVRHAVLAVNKIDLVGHAQDAFTQIAEAYRSFAADLAFASLSTIPISALNGDNVVARSVHMPWYDGPTLIEHLETIDVAGEAGNRQFRMEVDLVIRPNPSFRGYAGTISAGTIRAGDPIVVASSGRGAVVRSILAGDTELGEAAAEDAVIVTLDDEIDVARGDILAKPYERPPVADQFAAHVIWFSEEALLPGRTYLMRIGSRWLPATVTAIKHRVDINTLAHISARQLEMNEIAFCNVATQHPIAFDPYEENRSTGAFILVDRYTNKTCAAGMIAFALRRTANIRREALAIDREARAGIKHQKAAVLWFTGLSGAGKSTIARLVEQRLHNGGFHSYMLDGDNIRHGLNRDLGFTDVDRVENIRRVGEVAKLFADAGLIVLCAFISPFAAERQMVREMMPDGEFFEIFIDTPIEECQRRDPKGLYAKARAGVIKNFTGFDSPYEAPQSPEIVLPTIGNDAETLAEQVMDYLRRRGILGGGQ